MLTFWKFRPTAVFALTLVTVSVHAGHAEGQAVDTASPPTPPYGLFVQVGFEPQLAVALGYIRRLVGEDPASGIGVGAGLKVPPYRLGRGSGRVNLIAAGHWMPEGRWGGVATSQAYLARGTNRAGTIHGIGLELRAAPGYYGTHWNAAADLGWQATLLAHVRHSSDAKGMFDERYPGGDGEFTRPTDGWYGSTAHRFRIGLTGARTLSDERRLTFAIGSMFSIQSQGILLGFAHGQVPAYLETSLHFGRASRSP